MVDYSIEEAQKKLDFQELLNKTAIGIGYSEGFDLLAEITDLYKTIKYQDKNAASNIVMKLLPFAYSTKKEVKTEVSGQLKSQIDLEDAAIKFANMIGMSSSG